MSPVLSERTATEGGELGSLRERGVQGLLDSDPLPAKYGRRVIVGYPHSLLPGSNYERHHARYRISEKWGFGQQLNISRIVGSCLATLDFAVFDFTGTDTHHVSQLVAELALGATSHAQELVETNVVQFEAGPIAADFDQPLTGNWLAATFDAIFIPVTEEEVALQFDPDDYPVF